MVTLIVTIYTCDIIRVTNIKMIGVLEIRDFVDQAKRSYCVRCRVMRCLYGESSLTNVSITAQDYLKMELIVQSSAMNRSGSVRNSSDRRMRLLMSSGLIAGIIPTSIKKRSHQKTLDFVTKRQDGSYAEQQKADC